MLCAYIASVIGRYNHFIAFVEEHFPSWISVLVTKTA